MPLQEEIYGDGYLGSLSALPKNPIRSKRKQPLFSRLHAKVERSSIACWFDCRDPQQPLLFEGGIS